MNSGLAVSVWLKYTTSTIAVYDRLVAAHTGLDFTVVFSGKKVKNCCYNEHYIDWTQNKFNTKSKVDLVLN